MPGGELAALGDGALGGAKGDQVQALELVADVAPGVAEPDLGDSQQQQQGQPAQLDVGPDALVLVVVYGPQVDGGLQVAEAALGIVEPLVTLGDVGSGESLVAGAEQELAVEEGVAGGRPAVDAQLAGGGGAQEPVEGRLGFQRPGELGALARAQLVRTGDLLLEAGDDLGADLGVAGGAHGVVADDEPVPDRAVIDAVLLDPCVPITSSTSCDQAIFVDQATDASLFSDAVLVEIDRFGQWLQRCGCVRGAVRPVLIVMSLVFAQDPPQMGLVPDESAVAVLAAASADPAFGDRVHAGRPDVAEHGPDPGVGEDRVERGGEVRAAVADHERDPVRLVAEVHDQVAGLLGGPFPGGMLGDAEDADAPGGVLDYGQDVGLGGKRRDKPAWRRGCESPTSKE